MNPEPNETEANVIEQEQTRNLDAFGELLSSHDKALHEFIRPRVRAAHDMDDLVQETGLKAWQSRDSFKGDSDFRTWLFSIARHVVADDYRRQNSRAQALSALKRRTTHVTAGSVVGQCASREGIVLYLRCITSHLPLEQQVAMLLRDFHDLGDQEAAKTLGKSLRGFQRVLQAARAVLHRLCGGKCALIAKTGIPQEFCPPARPAAGGALRPLVLRQTWMQG